MTRQIVNKSETTSTKVKKVVDSLYQRKEATQKKLEARESKLKSKSLFIRG